MVFPKIDIVDENNQPVHQTATYEEVHDKGLWRRGVHVVIYTPDRKIVVQKRAKSLDYHPGDIEISVGGGVDAGEEPAQSALREIYEELGLKVDPRDLTFIGIKKFNHRYKSQGQMRYMRAFLYAYKVCIDEASLAAMKPAKGEVAGVSVVSKRKLLWSLRRHYIRGFGRLVPRYAFWAYLVKSVD